MGSYRSVSDELILCSSFSDERRERCLACRTRRSVVLFVCVLGVLCFCGFMVWSCLVSQVCFGQVCFFWCFFRRERRVRQSVAYCTNRCPSCFLPRAPSESDSTLSLSLGVSIAWVDFLVTYGVLRNRDMQASRRFPPVFRRFFPRCLVGFSRGGHSTITIDSGKRTTPSRCLDLSLYNRSGEMEDNR